MGVTLAISHWAGEIHFSIDLSKVQHSDLVMNGREIFKKQLEILSFPEPFDVFILHMASLMCVHSTSLNSKQTAV